MTGFGYPRPQLERPGWHSLNGPWEFAIDRDGGLLLPDEVSWDRTIIVPFTPETSASQVGVTGFFCACWYRRTFEAPPLNDGDRLVLHFGAIDHRATVWVNGSLVARHEGGYTPFDADITPVLRPGGSQDVVVRAEDDPHDLTKPRGKQDWQLEPHSIWYPRTTGIWQSVWLERLPANSISSLCWTSNLERWEIGFEAHVDGPPRDDLLLRVRLVARGQELALDDYRVIRGEVHRRIALSDPGIDDFRNELLWSPDYPTLVDAFIELRDQTGRVVDSVRSYTAIRSVAVQGDRFLLNNRPLFLRLVLDQGYWPGTGLTAPDDDALRRDVELTRAMGFNGVRKHQKLEDPRYLYWADRLGLLVWEEMPSAYRFTRQSVERLTLEWIDAIERDRSHPCIVAWVPFNESWGVPDLPSIPAQRHYVTALYHLTKTLDPDRPVIGNDGWESVATDLIGIHDYDPDPERIARRYGTDEVISRVLSRERPGGRLLMLGERTHTDQPIILSEFGGIAFSKDHGSSWGYSRAETSAEFAEQYRRLLEAVGSLPALAGFCYTQFSDTYQEANGLLYADRTPKFSLRAMALATKGAVTRVEVEREWRARLMEEQLDR